MRYKYVCRKHIVWKSIEQVNDNMYLGRDLEIKLGRTVFKRALKHMLIERLS